MKYFKNKTGDVFAYSHSQINTVANIDSPDYEFPIPQEFYDMREKLKNMTEMTGDEIEEHLNPSPTVAQLADNGRVERDSALVVLDTFVSNPLRYAELTGVQQKEATDYRQALLDVPQQKTFPESYAMPDVPSWLQ